MVFIKKLYYLECRYCILIGTLLGVFLTSLFFYPGYTNGDSEWQYRQAVNHQYDDWHPVIMAFVWHYLIKLLPGSAGIFLLHTLMYWLGLSIIVDLCTKRLLPFLFLLLIVGLFPSSFIFLSQIYKDTGMAASLLLVFALIWRAQSYNSMKLLLLTLPILFYAMAVRHNAIFAALPMVLWINIIIVRKYKTIFKYEYFAIIAMSLTFLLILEVLISWSTDKVAHKKNGITQALFIYDIVGISVKTNQNLVPSVYYTNHKPHSMNELKKIYSPQCVDGLLWRIHNKRPLGFIFNTEDFKRLKVEWLYNITNYPLQYFQHRFDVILSILGISYPHTFVAFFSDRTFTGKLNYRFTSHDNYFNTFIINLYNKLRVSVLFRSWVFLFLTIITLLFLCILCKKLPKEAIFLSSSSFLYAGGYLLVGICSDYRYTFWNVVVCTIMPLLILKQKPVINYITYLEKKILK